MFGEDMFLEECRCHNPEMSDDQIRLLYRLYRDDWVEDEECRLRGSVFSVLEIFSKDMLKMQDGMPVVRFRNLLRWRETTQLIGEDLLACCFLAHHFRDVDPDEFTFNEEEPFLKRFPRSVNLDWPSVLYNDNPELNYLFKQHGLCELHSHLYASTDNFTLSWVCLMNHISDRLSGFKKLYERHLKTRRDELPESLYYKVRLACRLRIELWKCIKSENDSSLENIQVKDEYSTDDELAALRQDNDDFDYVPYNYAVGDANEEESENPLSPFIAERRFLFEAFCYMNRHDSRRFRECFYRYILIKNLLRSFLVQVNDNRGFANFKRFQDIKTVFLTKKQYGELIPKAAIYEAIKFNYTRVMETRITPPDSITYLNKVLKSLSPISEEDKSKLALLFHFIKRTDYKFIEGRTRDNDLRRDVGKKSLKLRKLLNHSDVIAQHVKGIDAASSEIMCRPEVFSQAFRFLKGQGYKTTFHVGEDFFDIADGLRAIDETILFFGFEAGDRFGHALALGIDAETFYRQRNNRVIVPRQWMLDNLVWIYFKSRECNITIEPSTEAFIMTKFKELLREIGYVPDTESDIISLENYYCAMLLRGDNPKLYTEPDSFEKEEKSKEFKNRSFEDKEEWKYYNKVWTENSNKVKTENLKFIRQYNTDAKEIHRKYLIVKKIQEEGVKVKQYVLPRGYPALISKLQNEMMKHISKKRIGIECCPSSNVRIGYLSRFENHPILRFMPVYNSDSRCALAVTINTDDLGIFATSLPNEFSLMAISLLKMKDNDGNPVYSHPEVFDWIERIIKNGHIYTFAK